MFFGGTAPERDISVITGVLTLNCLKSGDNQPIAVFIDKFGKMWSGDLLFNLDFYKEIDYKKLYPVTLISGDDNLYRIKNGKIKKICKLHCALNCLHGEGGEDGTLAAIVKASNIAFASPDLFASALSIDKHYTKLVLKTLGVPCSDYIVLKRSIFYSRVEATLGFIEKKLGLPVIVKPATLGSSIGIKRVNSKDDLFAALCEAFNYGYKVICEKYFADARDINCAAYFNGEKVVLSPLEEAVTANDILTFEDKYGNAKSNGTGRIFPAELTLEQQNEIYRYSRLIYAKLDFSGIVRFDFLLSNNKIYLNEINAVPGSLAYYLFCNTMGEFSALLNNLIAVAEQKALQNKNYIKQFDSQVLSGNWQSVKK